MKHSDDKKKEAESNDWEFNIDQDKVQELNSFVPEKKVRIQRKSANKGLEVEDQLISSARTRESLFKTLEDEKKLDIDVIEHGNVIKRGLALSVDISFIFGLFLFAKKAVPFVLFLISLPMSRYKFQWVINENLLNKIFHYSNFGIFYFLLFLIPTLLFSTTLGKKLFKLQVRGVDQYTLTIEKVILRELILKPISIFSGIGFIVPFFNKNRRSLHDLIANTIVVED